METIYNDVWDADRLLDIMLTYGISLAEAIWTLWASPPCQAFSLAGSGAGRKALDQVLDIISRKQYVEMAELRDQAALLGDERIGLVLSPLHYAARFRPSYIALEQVPPVLPVWEAMAEELREMGYSVWTGLLNAEQFGVPQTRKRAILVATRFGEAKPPTPTHSRYYSRDAARIDPGVLPWVSMADALGWDEPCTAVKHMGAGMVERHGERPGREGDTPAFAVRANAGGTEPGGFRFMRSNYGTGGDPANRGERLASAPSATMTSKADRNIWEGRPATTLGADDRVAGPGRSEFVKGGVSRQDRAGTVKVTALEAAALQSYPRDFIWDAEVSDGKGGHKPMPKTKQFLQIGNAVPPLLAKAVLQALWGIEPPTITTPAHEEMAVAA
ncbi:hypothetical protein C3B60_15950 [Cryobacterium zongtaii]|nr:hypothetical protein C3B60_15950 [Cryobacterium zongtaii]